MAEQNVVMTTIGDLIADLYPEDLGRARMLYPDGLQVEGWRRLWSPEDIASVWTASKINLIIGAGASARQPVVPDVSPVETEAHHVDGEPVVYVN